MENNRDFPELARIWQSQPTEGFQMTPEELRMKIRQLNRKLWLRDWIASAACLVVLVSFSVFLFIFRTPVERVGSSLTLIGVGYLALQLWLNRYGRRASDRGAASSGNTASAAFYRTELARQRNFHRGAWFWSRLAVFSPGPLVFMIGSALVHPHLARFFYAEAVAFVLLGALAIPLNLRMSRCYELLIRALDPQIKAAEN